MKIKKISTIVAVLGVSFFAFADFDDSPYIPIWEGVKMPGKNTQGPEIVKGAFVKTKQYQGFEIQNVAKPTLQFFKAESATPTAAIIVCPGGAYRGLQYGHEGVDIANNLSKMGVSAFILKYRIPNEFNDKDRVYMDAQRAIRIIRLNAKKWNIDPDKIGFMGFSAGGHLSAWMSTNYDKKMYEPIDAADKLSVKPNFAVLVYPAWLNSKQRNPETKKNEDTLELASDISVTPETPPAFIVHNIKDKDFYRASIAYFLALEANKVPVDMHMFYEGGHGHGMHPRKKPVDQWFSIFSQWLIFNGYAPKQ